MKAIWPGVVLLVAGCADNPIVACTEEARPGLSVTVRDSLTAAAVASDVEVVAVDGAYADTVRASLLGSGVYSLAYERPGTYDVTVTHPDYKTWHQSAVQVAADECHVRTVALLARLQRS